MTQHPLPREFAFIGPQVEELPDGYFATIVGRANRDTFLGHPPGTVMVEWSESGHAVKSAFFPATGPYLKLILSRCDQTQKLADFGPIERLMRSEQQSQEYK